MLGTCDLKLSTRNMNVLPVIVRELRAQARQPFTFNLRVLGVAAVLATLALLALNRSLLPGEGGRAYVFLHDVLLVAIWILVPLSTADCISRERREGTLGLLFLTPLKALDIVFAKGLAHGLRALTLWLACLPVMVIPFLVGGLTWQISALSCAVNFSSIGLALGASILASSSCRNWNRSLALTIMLAVFLITAFGVVLLITDYVAIAPYVLGMNPKRFWYELYDAPGLILTGAVAVISGAGGFWTEVSNSLSFPGQRAAVIASGFVTVLSLLAAYGLMLLAAWNVRRRWQELPRSARAEKMERVFCTPVVGRSFFRWWMRRKLERNPIGWLEQRTWSGRLVTWVWLAVIISVYTAILMEWGIFGDGVQIFMAWLLVGSIASVAVGSFRRERESGVLELLLVTPLTAGQIINGRLRGMWGQFLPAIVTLLGIWLYLNSVFRLSEEECWTVWFFAGTFLTLPVIGLFFSLRCRNFVGGFLLTAVFGILAPMILEQLAEFAWWSFSSDDNSFDWSLNLSPWVLVAQLALAVVFAVWLRRRLATRSFSFNRT